MLQFRLLSASAVAAATLWAGLQPGAAQQNQEWFVPNQAQRPATQRPPARPAAPVAGPQQGAAVPGLVPEGVAPGAEGQQPQVQVQLPPPPEVPPLPKGPTPPAAIVGVLSVPDVMRASSAFQQADKEFLGRRQKLNEDAQKEQVTLRDLGQQLANERGKLTPDQIRTREKELQDRITELRRTFGERNRIIQEASQYVMAQIDRAVELVTQQVAISRGINIVLNRAQILGTTSDFDLTPAVVDDLNKVLVSVIIPPAGRLAGRGAGPVRRGGASGRGTPCRRAAAGGAGCGETAREAACIGRPAPLNRTQGEHVDWPPVAGDPRFFQRSGPFSLAAVVDAAQAEAPPHRLMLSGVAPLQTAGPGDVSFLDNRKYASALAETRAGAVIVHPEMTARVPRASVAVATTEPYTAWARVAALFHPVPPPRAGIHPSAVVADDASIDSSAEVGPLAVIGSRAKVGARCRIGPSAVIGEGVVLGADCRIGAHVSLSHALLGARVVVFPGARVGQDGFGFAITLDNFVSVPQLGRVVLEDDVEVGANTTIDRGSLRDTVIGAGSRLDNLVQIGHNVRLGHGCVVVALAGISGSTILEDHVMVGGQAGLTGHLRIGRGARIGAQSGVMSDVQAGSDVVGSPAQPAREFFRHLAILRRLIRNASSRSRD